MGYYGGDTMGMLLRLTYYGDGTFDLLLTTGTPALLVARRTRADAGQAM